MEESFRVRIEKTFGSLSSSSSSSSSSSKPISSSLWSLTDDELQPNRWTRESDDPLSDDDTDDVDKSELQNALNDHSSFPRDVHKLFVSSSRNPNPNPNREDGSDDGREPQPEGASSSCVDGGIEADELDVRNSIGLDSTLDFEEEEDEFDKVAIGKEKPDDRLYVCDASDYVSHIEPQNEVPNTFQEASRDPRANHIAAKLRLKEDAETARDFNSLHVSEKSLLVASNDQINTHDGEINLKSILKRKEDQMDSMSEKRVRFDPTCKSNDGDEYEVHANLTSEAINNEITPNEGVSSQIKQTSLIPDYIRNPSKYTHYTFDTSSDMNEASNRQAYADFLSMLRKSKQSGLDEAPADLSKPVVFNPKKKPRDLKNETDCAMQESTDKKISGITVAGSELEDETCEMEIDEEANSTLKGGNVRKIGRRYRSKLNLQYEESDA